MPLGWFEWFSFEGQKENEVIKSLLKDWINNVFSGITFWILDYTYEFAPIKAGLVWMGKHFSVYPESHNNWKTLLKSYEVTSQIQKVVQIVWDLLSSNWFNDNKGKKGKNIVKNSKSIKTVIEQEIAYRAYIFWVLALLQNNWFDTEAHKKKLEVVPDKVGKIIYDILKDPALSTLLVVLKSYWLIDISQNQINEYEVEEEVKILNIDSHNIMERLEWEWAEKVFEWEVEDVYYDYPEWTTSTLEVIWWIKSTFRIRRKTSLFDESRYFYTIKRKLTPDEEDTLKKSKVLEEALVNTRRCYEKELEIKDFSLFQKIIVNFWLVEVRRKKKDRISYSVDWIKFDFDKYNGYNDMVEIEANSNALIPIRLRKLDLFGHERLVWWSRAFFANESAKERTLKNKEKWNAWKRNKSSWNK